jgi:molybdate transport system ATP-binding protein
MLYVDIRKQFKKDGQATLNLDVSFTVRDGISVLFGPSGSGKTTILRAIAGIIEPDEGKIALGGQTYFDSLKNINLPIRERGVGLVLQDYALFPHLTAEKNVAYGIKSRVNKTKRERARQMLSLFSVEHTADRPPSQLSGGEQQRVALARALASDPSILLLDEPLSAVDVTTRSRLLEEIISVQKNLGIPFVYVTHNQAETVHISNHVILVHKGQIVQEGKPIDVFNAPDSLSSVHTVGNANIFLAQILEHKASEGLTTVDLDGCQLEVSYNPLPVGTHGTIAISSEDIIVSCEPTLRTSARNVVEGTVKNVFIDREKAELIVSCGVNFKVSVTLGTVKALALHRGTKIYLLIKARACHFIS